MILYRELREAILSVPARPAALAGGTFAPAQRERLAAAPHLAGLLGEIRAEAERARREPAPALTFALFRRYRSFGTRKEYENPYFARRARLLALTLTMLLDDTDDDVEALENIVWDICGEYAWAVPAHLPEAAAADARVRPERVVDLFAAETAHALAETVYLVGDRLDEQVTRRVKEEIERRVFGPAFESSARFLWEAVTNNWAAVCGGAAGMAALLLVDDRERLAGMQHRVVSAMESFLAGYGDDGCCAEGVGYWNYGFGYFVYWAEMLRAYTGGVVDLLRREKIARIAAFPAAAALSAGTCVNYSDCEEAFAPNTGLISRLCDRLGIAPPEMTGVPSFHADHCYRWPHQVRNLLWTDRNRLSVPAADRTDHFPSTDWLIVKRGAPRGLLAFSAKGGHNHEAHNHNDLGHFIVHAGGETLLADLGGGVYTREYFGPERYSFLHNASAGHSVPVINGRQQAAGQEHRAVVTRLEAGSAADTATVAATTIDIATAATAAATATGTATAAATAAAATDTDTATATDTDTNTDAATAANADTNTATVRFELDLTAAYPAEAGLRSFSRLFEWDCRPRDNRAQLILTDRFAFADAAPGENCSVTEHFISYCAPVLSRGEAVWQGQKATVALRFDPTVLAAEVETLETRRHDTRPVTVYRLRLHADRPERQFACCLVIDCRIGD